MDAQIFYLMCQETKTDGDLGLTWMCDLPMHTDGSHHFQVIKVHMGK